jgi:geranylgeranyl diphosphate synthase type II
LTHEDRLNLYIDWVEDALERYIPNIPIPQARLLESMHYSLFSGGKRIRPVLLFEFCRITGGDPIKALPFACALEMIHTYSLIHDDLPCMDNDTLRRGRPTNHLMFGEDFALLAGDSLLSAAFEIMMDLDYVGELPPEKVLRAAHTIAWNSGAFGMAGGQSLDIDSEMQDTLYAVSAVHNLKTGALISAACEAGCFLGNATYEQLCYAKSFARSLGIAYQIRDDILNLEGTTLELGKSVGSDIVNDRITFVRVAGLDSCKEMVHETTMDSIGYLKKFENTEFLEWLASSLVKRSS